MDEVSDYQKVAALLSLDIEITARAVRSNPHLAEGLVAKLEENRARLIDDPAWRDMRYGAANFVFNVAAASDSDGT